MKRNCRLARRIGGSLGHLRTRLVMALALLGWAGLCSGAFAQSLCQPGPTTLCLASGRFSVAAAWSTGTASAYAPAVRLTPGSGYFTFFGADSPEVVVKAIDGCAFNGRYWIFVAGMTNVEVSLTVTDMQTHIIRTYTNPLGRTFVTQMDTNAFPACPEQLACRDPSPLYGEFHPEAPGYIVVFREGTIATATAEALAAKYGFVLAYVYEFALLGFSAQLTPETVSALRCEPPVLYIEHNVPVIPADGTLACNNRARVLDPVVAPAQSVRSEALSRPPGRAAIAAAADN